MDTPAARPVVTRLVFGLDLAKFSDFAALALLERRTPLPDPDADDPDADPDAAPPPPTLHLTGLRRWALGTTYHTVVDEVAGVVAGMAARWGEPHRPPPRGVALVMDATGVGAPVAELFRRHPAINPLLTEVTITAGAEVNAMSGGYKVPKRDLVAGLQVALGEERLKFARLPETPNLLAELREYQARITASGSLTWGAPAGQHDDLLMAVALACWYAERDRDPTRKPIDLSGFGKPGAVLPASSDGDGGPVSTRHGDLARSGNRTAIRAIKARGKSPLAGFGRYGRG